MWRATQTAPGVAVTSGYEAESLFAIWRAAHGGPVYADATRLPFASAYFNWLFYAGYAVPVGITIQTTGDASLPLAARLMTVTGASAGALVLFLLLRKLCTGGWLLPAALASFAFAGPLVSWWSFTARPDVWALALETFALAVLLQGWRTRPLVSTALACILFYCAWACKATYIAGLGAAALFLLHRRQWGALLLLSGLSGMLWVATFTLLGPVYRAAFASTASNNVYLFIQGLHSLVDFIGKTGPLWVLVLGLALRKPGAKHEPSPLITDAITYSTLGLAVMLPLTFASTCKVGAASYYYFPSLLLLTVLAGGLIARRGITWIVPAGLVLGAGLQALALSGRAGHVDLKDQTGSVAAIWQTWRKEPEPRFSDMTNLNLPWLNAASPPLVLAFNYDYDRRAGGSFEHGGVGGMITAGYFHSLLLPADTTNSYDGGRLDRYRREEIVGAFAIYRRRGDAAP